VDLLTFCCSCEAPGPCASDVEEVLCLSEEVLCLSEEVRFLLSAALEINRRETWASGERFGNIVRG
jgi:hypothetical protein